MKANELRIGNWVQLEIMKPYRIEPHHFYFKDGYSEVIDLSIPIPLTEEILLKCGFKKLDKYTFVCNGWFIHFRVKKNSFIYNKRTVVKHLHELQNLFYCLTGEELNIEL